MPIAGPHRPRGNTKVRKATGRGGTLPVKPVENPEASFTKRIREKYQMLRLWVLGIALIGFGFVVEENLNLFWGWIAHLNGKGIAPVDYLHIMPLDLLFTVLIKEIGVAVVVAAIIVGSIERRAQEVEHASAEKLRQEVANDAVFAIFSVQHTREFVRAAVETNLGAQIVRENAHLDYSLRPLTKPEARTIWPNRIDEALQRFVICQMVSNYTLRNVSASGQTVRLRFDVDVRQGEGARSLSGARHICIDGEALSDEDIRKGQVPTGPDEDLRYEWERWVEPGEEVKILIAVCCLKEHSDNDVWESFFPTMGEMTFSLSVLPSMVFGVRPLSNSEIKHEPTVPSKTAKTWRMQGPLLRHDSLVFWWRTPEDEGRKDKSAPNSFSANDAPERFVRDLVDAQTGPKHDTP